MNQRKLNNHAKAPFNEMKKRKLSLLLHFMPGKTCGDKGTFLHRSTDLSIFLGKYETSCSVSSATYPKNT